MSKAVMLSIQPKWCELIASGKKTVEVRKTRPKLETPFKCYIYQTKKTWLYDIYSVIANWQGKVIGEFTSYDIVEYETEFYSPKKQPVYEAITKWNEENEVYEAVASNCDTYQTNFLNTTCMTLEDFREYLGIGEVTFYGWHISDLVIYDEPKDLTDFFVEGECYPSRCSKCKYFDKGNGYNVEDDCLLPHHLNEEGNDVKPLFKAPQSWCYVEEISGA